MTTAAATTHTHTRACLKTPFGNIAALLTSKTKSDVKVLSEIAFLIKNASTKLY